MSVRGLEHADPHAVPLPVGTEVKTTAPRRSPLTGRLIPRGAVGRVVATTESGVTVHVVGVGELDYLREELIPRRRGQLRFAVEREGTERALEGCAILSATVGSRAWGLADEGSDVDTRGVFLFPFPWTASLVPLPDVVVSSDGSHTRWELERTLHQALRADPNTLEMLFVPDVVALNPMGEALLSCRDAFVTTKIYGSFGRYALAQAKKLEQSLRLAEHRGLVLEWLKEPSTPTLDELAERLAREALQTSAEEGKGRARQYLKQLYNSMHDQGLLEAASFAALLSFAKQRSADFDLPRELRPKNAYNLLRIVSCAVHWLETGEPLIRVEGELRDRLLAIKSGEVPLQRSLRWTEDEAARLEAARSKSSLPEFPDVQRANALLQEAREWAARRWFEQADDPWGSGSPPPPAVKGEGIEDD